MLVKMKLGLVVASAFAAIGAVPGVCGAVSFDCSKAQSFREKAVCSNPELGGLDDLVNSAYQGAIGTTEDKQGLVDSQRQWLRDTDRCTDEACILAAYRQRFDELNGDPEEGDSDNVDEPSGDEEPADNSGRIVDQHMEAERELSRRRAEENRQALEEDRGDAAAAQRKVEEWRAEQARLDEERRQAAAMRSEQEAVAAQKSADEQRAEQARLDEAKRQAAAEVQPSHQAQKQETYQAAAETQTADDTSGASSEQPSSGDTEKSKGGIFSRLFHGVYGFFGKVLLTLGWLIPAFLLIQRIRIELKGYVVDPENDEFSFPGGLISANSVSDYFKPKFLTQALRRFTIPLSEIQSLSAPTIQTTKVSEKGFVSQRNAHYVEIQGSFGAAKFRFFSQGKRDQLFAALRQANQMGMPVFRTD